jgi:hypothetical protein
MELFKWKLACRRWLRPHGSEPWALSLIKLNSFGFNRRNYQHGFATVLRIIILL